MKSKHDICIERHGRPKRAVTNLHFCVTECLLGSCKLGSCESLKGGGCKKRTKNRKNDLSKVETNWTRWEHGGGLGYLISIQADIGVRQGTGLQVPNR